MEKKRVRITPFPFSYLLQCPHDLEKWQSLAVAVGIGGKGDV